MSDSFFEDQSLDEQMMSDGSVDEENNLSSVSRATEEIRGFQFDPVLSKENKLKREEARKIRLELIEARSKPVDQWCKCTCCAPLLDPIENVCCHDDDSSKSWLDETVTCITNHEGFKVTVLNEHSLNMTRGHLMQIIKDPSKISKFKSDAPDTYRHLSYINFRSWVSYGRKLGFGNRVVTPACVVREIRERWPEPSGRYTGFRPSQNMIDDQYRISQ
jgi:hypothetical protein